MKKQRLLKQFQDKHLAHLKKIHRMESIYHKATFSIKDPHDVIEEKLHMKIDVYPTSGKQRSSHSIYAYQAFPIFEGFKLHLMTGLKDKYKGKGINQSMISVIPPDNFHFQEQIRIFRIMDTLFKNANMTLSEIELATDLFARFEKLLNEIFDALCKFFYISHITDEESVKFFDSNEKYGRMLKISKKDSKNRRKIKIYERKDEHQKELNRVRIELTIVRDELRRLRINTFDDLIIYRDKKGYDLFGILLSYIQFREVSKGHFITKHDILMKTIFDPDLPRKGNYVTVLKRLIIFVLQIRIKKAIKKHSLNFSA